MDQFGFVTKVRPYFKIKPHAFRIKYHFKSVHDISEPEHSNNIKQDFI